MADFELQCKNYDDILVAPAAAKVKGEFDTYNEVHGFYFAPITAAEVALGETRALIIRAPRVYVEKTTGETWAPGEAVAWVAGTGKVSNVIGTDILIGYVVEAAVSAATYGVISFDGYAAYLKA